MTGPALPAMASPPAVTERPATATDLAAELRQRDSATATLQRHCPLSISARSLGGDSPPALMPAARIALNPPAAARLVVRHVLLSCGKAAWSEAWNLYLPDRLSPRTRQRLADGHTPFGRAVGERNFQRDRLSSQFAPLLPGIVLENRARLRRRVDGAGFAFLVERYTQAVLRPVTKTTTGPERATDDPFQVSQ